MSAVWTRFYVYAAKVHGFFSDMISRNYGESLAVKGMLAIVKCLQNRHGKYPGESWMHVVFPGVS